MLFIIVISSTSATKTYRLISITSAKRPSDNSFTDQTAWLVNTPAQ